VRGCAQGGDEWEKAERGDWQHNRMWKGDGMGRGVGVSKLAPHGRVAANLGFNKPLRFDNQTLFCLFLGF
jgi:hypothetical protein